MKPVANKWQTLPGWVYTCLVAVSFGATLLDVLYSHAASVDLASPGMAAMFSIGADFLLLVTALAFLAGLVAIGATWSVASARYLFIASLFFVAAGFLTPVLFGSLIQRVYVLSGLNLGTGIRLAVSVLSLLPAFAGLWKLYPSAS
jgi:hypothetical protein